MRNPLYTILLPALLLFFAEVNAQKSSTAPVPAVPIYDFSRLDPLLHPSIHNDTTYIFNFWATYCAPCITELPYFGQIEKEFASKKLKVILVSLDFKSQLTSRVLPFLEKNKISSRVILLSDPDANAWIDKVSAVWSGAIPATLIIKGDRREFYEKSFTYNELRLLTIKFLEK